MTYQDTLEYLFTRLPMYQRVGKVAYKKDLTNTIALLEVLDNPHTKFKSIHIAGTNGKGTSAHGIAAILQSAGYKTGLYTSPHLKQFTERIRIDGKEVDQEFVIDFVDKLKPHIDRITPSFFEITVAMAFTYFAEEKVDIAVIETGLGGRLDSTNVIIPEACLITNIGYDHMDLLGDTLDKIAFEKAGIIKNGVPVVIGEATSLTRPVFENKAKDVQADITYAKSTDWLPGNPLIPNYLIKNVPGIKTLIQILIDKGWHIEERHIEDGLAHMNELTGLKGRFQVLSQEPLIIADVSHNLDGLRILFEQIRSVNSGKLHLIFGTVKEKELGPIFELFPSGELYWTQSMVPRALPVEDLNNLARQHGLLGTCFTNVNEAIHSALSAASKEDLILITGSTFIIGEIDQL